MTAVNQRSRARPSDRLLTAVAPRSNVTIVMHDNPDPDAIASGWAVRLLLETKTDKPVRLVAGGDIVRAENRHMVHLLRPPLELIDELKFTPETAVVLVDCGPDATHHLISGEKITPAAIIDHHRPASEPPGPTREETSRPAAQRRMSRRRAGTFADIRPQVAATASIAATYLREQRIEPESDLATAMLYAIRSETRGGETDHSRTDRIILPWLTHRADPGKLAEIENAPLRWQYFGDLALALLNTTVYGNTAFCLLPRAEGPEIIGEVADLLIRCETIDRACCAAVHDRTVLLSVRTDDDAGNATELLHQTIHGLGRGGGHTHRAGGKLTISATGSKIPADIQCELRLRWLQACGAHREAGIPLVDRREIADTLNSTF